MLTKSQVDAWLSEFVAKLREVFGERLVWVGHHGSWARGEPRPESDVDCTVVVDRMEDDDLASFRDIVHSMPDAAVLASGSIMSILELRMTPRFFLVQVFHGRKVLYGGLDGLVEPLTSADLVEDVKIKADENLHVARHYLLYPHDLAKAVHNLKYHFKRCFYALQSWHLLLKGEFIDTKVDLLDALDDPIDKEVVRVARDWYDIKDDLSVRPAYYIELLERWGRGMMHKLQTFAAERDGE